MAKYLSNRQKNLKIGVGTYTENNTVLEVTGKVGIGTTNATSTLYVVGDANIIGVVTANSFSGSGSALTGIVTYINAGSGISINQNTGSVTITATGGGGGGGGTGVTIQDEGSVVGVADTITTLNFVGANVSATASGSISTITVASNLVGTALSISGISTLGVTTFTGTVSFGTSAYFGDNDKLVLGDGGDLEIFHDGTQSLILDNGTGQLRIGAENTFYVGSSSLVSPETYIRALYNGAVELYYDNSKEFETTGYGATVYGILETQGLLSTGISTISVNSTSNALRITQLGSGNALVVEDETNPDATPFVVNASGSVGIGTTNPTSKLEVYESTGTDIRLNTAVDRDNSITFAENGTNYFRILYDGSGLVSPNNVFKIQTATGTAGIDNDAITIKQSGDVGIGTTNPTYKAHILDTAATGAGLLVQGGGAGGNIARFERIVGASATLAINANSSNPQFQFSSTSNTISVGLNISLGGFEIADNTVLGTNTRFFVARSSGNVGVGITNPQGNLHISSGTSGDCRVYIEADTDNNNEGDNPYIIFKNDGGAENASVWCGNADGANDNSLNLSNATNVGPGGIRFFTSSVAGGWETAPERLRITPSGDVGIGTTNPQYKLHVVGSFGATTKSFIIDHPTKEGKKLQYGSLEGPELGVYVRGRTQTTTIELPDYWTGLVDEETITVNLTPIGRGSPLHSVVEIANNTVVIESANETIDCFYTVFAERKDVAKLEVEF